MSGIVTVDPARGTEIERFDYMTAHEIDAHLDSAAAAFRRWSTHPLENRTQLLTALAKSLRANSDALSATAVREMGKPIAQAKAEVEKCAWACDYFAAHAAELLAGQDVPMDGKRGYVDFRPLGTILAIMPWNFPFWQVFRAAAPALAAGNTVVLKHADNTTRCALEIQRIFDDAGAPPGLFRTLLIDHEDADERISDERIAAVTLTGSERAGVAVAGAAGRALKKCVLELGGSDPFIVLSDCRLDDAVKVAVTARFQNNGQSCIAAKRFIVEDTIYDRFVNAFGAAAHAQRVGDPMKPDTQIGPCARADLRENLQRQVEESVQAGARIVTGGKPIGGSGFFFEPTIVADVESGAPMFREETFGPAAAVVRARDADHALELTNDSKFGLGANIWTENIERARHLAQRIESGMVAINGMVASDPRLPFGGVKRSGYGRELSVFGIHEFVNIQAITIG